MVTVTADLKVDLEPESVELNVGNEKAVQIKAVDKKNQAHTATWTVTSDNQEVAAVTEPADGQIKVTGVTAGETQSASQRPAQWAARTTPPRPSCR